MKEEIIVTDNNDGSNEDIVALEYTQHSFTITPVENSVIKKAIEGDEKAFETLFMGTYRYVFAAARKYLNNDQDIYDAIQDTYTRVYRGLPRLESVSSFYPWLHRIAVNCAKDVLKDSQQNTLILENESIPSGENSTDSSDVSADISEVLKQLPPEQAELLIRVYYDKLRVAEIARMQNVPVTTVHNRLKAAKKNLKQLLKIRGIDKPIYSGEFISMISTALRDAIGTQLLSIAIAEEILHSITGTKNKKGAFVVSTFARKMRNKAVKNLAAILLLTCLLTTTVVLFVVGIITRSLSGNEKYYDNASTLSVESHPNPSEDVNTSSEDMISSLPSITDIISSGTVPDTSSSDTLSLATSSSTSEIIEEVVPNFLSSFESSENFGTFVEDGYMHIATSKDYVYGWEIDGSLFSISKDYVLDCFAYQFNMVYDETGCFLNVFDDKIYWISTNSQSQFVLNSYRVDGNGNYSYSYDERKNMLYSKVFDKGDCTFVKNMLVAKDGIYFIAGTADSATLYRTDYDFNIKDSISDVADFGIINDKIYYLYGKGNYGLLYSADRADFGNKKCVSPDNLNYGSISTIGEFLILDPSNEHGQSKYKTSTDCIVIDTVAGKVVRTIHGNSGDDLAVYDVSDYKDGTIIYTHNGESKMFNITTGKTEEFLLPLGTIFGNYKYYYSGCFCKSDIYNPDKYTVIH